MVHQWIAIGVTVGIFVLIQFRRSTPLDYLFLFGLLIVSVCGILSPEDAIAGFANPAVITLAALFALTAGLKVCGVLDWVGAKLLGNVTTEFGAFWRLGLVLVTSSAFLLNTALVAMMAPIVSHWCRKNHVAPSRLLIPVSYFVILGGVCTLIGTSTTLVVNARLQQSHAEEKDRLALMIDHNEAEAAIAEQEKLVHAVRPLGFLELAVAGVPIAIVGSVIMFVIGRQLLPKRKQFAEIFADQRREYLVEMEVKSSCPLIGMSVEQARLRQLKGLFLIEIDRAGKPITPVSPEETIEENDRLVFTGLVETIVELEMIPGLSPTSDRLYEFKPGVTEDRVLTEVVLSRSSPIIGMMVRRSNFRERYDAVIVAVHRNGERLPNKIGDIVLQPGDTLLLQSNAQFYQRYRNSREFYLVSRLGEVGRVKHKKMPIAAAIMAALLAWLVVASFFGESDQSWTSPAIAALVAVVLFIMSGCLKVEQARAALDVQLLVTIACALGLGLALERSGAAHSIAETVVSGIQHPFVLLIAVYVMSMLMTEMITNNAVAALMFPIAVNIAITAGFDPRPFVIAVCLASSLAFLTPIGYQTNLMVMGPGGYRPLDFFRVGTPVSLGAATTAILVIPFFWPFN